MDDLRMDSIMQRQRGTIGAIKMNRSAGATRKACTGHQFLAQNHRREVFLPASCIPLVARVVVLGVRRESLMVQVRGVNWQARILGQMRNSVRRRSLIEEKEATLAGKMICHNQRQLLHGDRIQGGLVDPI
ncbi:MAG: hypothetical protein ACYDBH_25195 [Acidobacteriaceae bacterium]